MLSQVLAQELLHSSAESLESQEVTTKKGVSQAASSGGESLGEEATCKPIQVVGKTDFLANV